MSSIEHSMQNPQPMSWLERRIRAGLIKRLGDLQGGRLTLTDSLDSVTLGGGGSRVAAEAASSHARPGLDIELKIHDSRFYRLLASGGSLGAGEAYFMGFWDCSDLPGLIQLLLRNRDVIDSVDGGMLSRITAQLNRIWHRWNRNSIAGSRDNIAAHYDLSNELFETFLDSRMQYSCAWFDSDDLSLEDAQRQKLRLLGEKLRLGPDHHLLEIGTGWGGLAEFMATEYGCRVTTTTISEQQHQAASERIQRAGLADRVTLKLDDYRDLTGEYDRLVSVEMVEAVGHQYLDRYFQVCRQRLKNDGLAVIQAITIDDQIYPQALKEVDYIKRYIFPGSFIPCVSVLTDSAARAGLRLTHLQDIGDSYAHTLKLWRERLDDAREVIEKLGFDETFLRMFRYYFAYCEGGFRERTISDVQLCFTAPAYRGPLTPVTVNSGADHG